MRKKILFIGLALALALAAVGSGVALAAKPEPFEANGTITDIEIPTEWQAGKSDRWVVVEREISGTLYGSIGGTNGADFTMTYRGNFSVLTQAGTFHGTVTAESYVLKVDGRIKPLEMVPTPFGFDLPKLTIEGRWKFAEGPKGEGDLDAYVIFIPDEEGHVGVIVDSAFDLTGRWQP